MEMKSPTKKQLIVACMADLRRIVKALSDYSAGVERRFSLTGPQLWALWELGRAYPCTLTELAERMKLDPSTVVGVVDRLVAKGLAERRHDQADRRCVALLPTSEGSDILAAAPHPAQGHLLAGLAKMPFRRVQELHAALQTLVGVLEAQSLEVPFFFAKE